MSAREVLLTFALSLGACAADAEDFGAPVAPAELARYAAIPPSGVGLPHGRGEVEQGRAIYADRCAACHGDHLQGVKETGGVALIGGRGTLASPRPLKTVESYWPYATTLFDYVRRAMPFNAPGSLTDDEVYAVSAYILASGHVIAPDATLDETSLPKVEMPNRLGFYRDPRPR
jgi:cytochrome c